MKKLIKKTKGFTLIEVIVVLLILSILSSIGLPAMTGFTTDAQERAIIGECRNCVMATVAIGADRYAKQDPVTNNNWNNNAFLSKVYNYADTPEGGVIESMTFAGTTLSILYYSRDSIIVKYENKKYTIVDHVDKNTGGNTTGGAIVVPDTDGGDKEKEKDPTPKYAFTIVDKTMTEEEKLTAIKENAKALITLFEACLQEELDRVSKETGHEILYIGKYDASLSGTYTSCTLYYKDVNGVLQKAGTKFTLDPMTKMNAILSTYGTIDISNSKIVYNSVYGTDAISYPTVQYIRLKSAALTGTTSLFYVYTPATKSSGESLTTG